jgi:hypothetical protein
MKSVIIDCQDQEKILYPVEDPEEEVIAFDIRDKNATSERPVVSFAYREGGFIWNPTRKVNVPWTVAWVCWQLYVWSKYSPEWDEATLEITRAINGMRPSKNSILWLLFANQPKDSPALTMCAVILADRVDGRVFIRSCCVNPMHCEKGYGTAAVSLFVKSETKYPIPTEEWLVMATSASARLFWERLGWIRRRLTPLSDDLTMFKFFEEARIKNAAVYSFA